MNTDSAAPLPAINPDDGATALGARLFGVIEDPPADLLRVTASLLDHRVGLDDIAFSSRGGHRRPADDVGTAGNATFEKLPGTVGT